MKTTAASLLISLSTYPNFNIDEHVNSILTNFKKIKKSRNDLFATTTEFDPYFNGVVYHLWGFWDLCVISVVDNAEIVSTLIEKDITDGKDAFLGQSYSKLFSGISFNNIGSALGTLINGKQSENQYIGIVNLKFSSDWYMPLGNFLSYSFLKTINKTLSGYKFYPTHSFTTYDITLIILGNNLDDISNKIFEIREMRVSNLMNYQRDKEIFNKNKSSLLAHESHLFIDTHSYFGTKLIKKNDKWGINSVIQFKDIKAVFEIESKPGHTYSLEKALDNVFKGSKKVMQFQSGHSDFFINSNYDINAFNEIYKLLRDDNSEIRKHIRKFKTKLLFEYKQSTIESKNGNFEAYNYFNLSSINDSLKAVKVSKSLRNQIVKLFYLYQNAFKDRVNYNIYIDLFYFVKKLETNIISYKYRVEESLSFKYKSSNSESVIIIEKELRQIIDIFKSAFYMRFVNDRSIENIQNFLIPYNSQMQTIISFYDSYAKSVLEKVTDNKQFGRSIILTFSDHITQINELNIQLLSNNLFEPGLVFNALSKEIITIINQKHYSEFIEENRESLRKKIQKYFQKHPYNQHVKYLYRLQNFDFMYGIVDYLRYKYFYKSDFKLFMFYHMGFNLQYPKLYDSNGNMNDNHLFVEVYRVVLLCYYIDKIDKNKDVFELVKSIYKAPSIRIKWNKYFESIKEFIEDFEMDFDEPIFKYIFKLVAHNKRDFDYKKLINQNNKIVDSYVKLSYDFMYKIYIKSVNNNIIYVLTPCRNWIDGKVKVENIKSNKFNIYPYFLFDSQGGTFFVNFQNLTEYTQLRNKTFENLRNLSLDYKSKIYDEIKKQKI